MAPRRPAGATTGETRRTLVPAASDVTGSQAAAARNVSNQAIFEVEGLNVHYGDFHAVRDITMHIPRQNVTAFIGPSGCGKSTVLRSFNRMNDLIPGARVTGSLRLGGQDVYAPRVDPVALRRLVGMVFQKPNPFPKSVYDNVAFGPRAVGMTADLDTRVERALRDAALWDEVKDKLNHIGTGLSGGQQQRLCIARAIAVEPQVILMDEPCSSLDPIATLKIEDLIRDLTTDYSIVIVTHNMQQAARVSDHTAFFTIAEGTRTGELVEFSTTDKLFTNADDERTEAYITGRFG